jgi:ATP-binding cassette subfamily F protein uup
MSRLLIGLTDVMLTFGGKPLFEGLNLSVIEGDKICLVGKNGAGKTTLMRLICGEQDFDAGERFVLGGTRIGYLAQKVEFKNGQMVKDFVLEGLPKDDHFEEKRYLADVIIGPLGLEPEWEMQNLSGGQQRRAALAKALINEPDVLMLDEPTNHLDLGAIEWLESYLASYKGALICVSHDKTFLRNISDKVFWIDRGSIRTCPSGYAQFDDWAEQIIEQEARALKNAQKKMEAEHDWTQGGVTGRRKRNVRRLRELERLREKIRTDKSSYINNTKKINAENAEIEKGSRRVAEFIKVFKSYGDKKIFENFNATFLRGDRIGLLGSNGSGKSTLLKMLIGELLPDMGTVKRAKNIQVSYFDQYRTEIDETKTLWESLCPDGGDYVFIGSADKQKARHVCGYLRDFLFDPKSAKDKVGTLSGGQQNRLMLARILANPGNVLILDEPTNDLDSDTLEMLQEILADYKGTLVLVSHDRDFLDKTVTEIIAFEGDGVVNIYAGGYTDYLLARQKEAGTGSAKAAASKEQVAAKKAPTKLSYKFKFELESLPAKIDALQNEISELNILLADSDLYSQDPDKFDAAMKRYGKAKQELEKAETRWLELEEMKEASGS